MSPLFPLPLKLLSSLRCVISPLSYPPLLPSVLLIHFNYLLIVSFLLVLLLLYRGCCLFLFVFTIFLLFRSTSPSVPLISSFQLSYFSNYFPLFRILFPLVFILCCWLSFQFYNVILIILSLLLCSFYFLFPFLSPLLPVLPLPSSSTLPLFLPSFFLLF